MSSYIELSVQRTAKVTFLTKGFLPLYVRSIIDSSLLPLKICTSCTPNLSLEVEYIFLRILRHFVMAYLEAPMLFVSTSVIIN